MTEDQLRAVENAIMALQKVAIAHPSSGEHSREMYQIAEEARSGLIKIIKELDRC